MSGKLFIISAPSGTGKTSLLKHVMSGVERIVFSISHTTRPPRTGEGEGRDYYFVRKERFQEMVAAGEFLEWAVVHDNYYGTALSAISEQLKRNYDVILDIDVQGAEIIRSEKKLPASHVFIIPPDMAELENRLRGRGTENEQTIQKRLRNARDEILQCQRYDYVVVNDTLQRAAQLVSSIICAERARGRRTAQGIPIDLESLR